MPEFLRYELGAFTRCDRPVVREAVVTLLVNGRSLGSMMVTPDRLEDFALGFLWLEGFITEARDVMEVGVEGDEVRVTAHNATLPVDFQVRTTGLHEGDALRASTPGAALTVEAGVTPEQVFDFVRALNANAGQYRQSGGVHTTALICADGTLVVAEDVGRHNTVDKLVGECLRRGLPMAGGTLVASGRLTVEFVHKAARMGVPVLISRTSPTDLALAAATALGLTLIGYARGGAFNLYTHHERVNGQTPEGEPS